MKLQTAILMGTFMVFPLDLLSFRNFSGKSKLEQVPKDKKTTLHNHGFLSAYITNKLNLSDGNTTYELPKMALVMVPLGQAHSWIASDENGEVGSVGHDHPEQSLV